MSIPELLAPAGDWPSLNAALEAGADSVYFGLHGLNMREAAENFETSELPRVMAALHDKGRRGYLALNTVMLSRDLSRIRMMIDAVARSGVDAVIAWDLAVVRQARVAGLTVHLSTQASVANIEAVEEYAALGARRVVLARECTLADIAEITSEIRRRGIVCEVEVFIHGAMCVSVSGRCFMSHEAFGKSANRGECLQPCRREFRIQDADGESEYFLGSDYVLSPKDLCTIDFLDRVIETGAACLKIEGRMRPPEYVRRVTQVYRQALDAYARGELTDAFKGELKVLLGEVYHRGFSSGFYFGAPGRDDWSQGLGHSHTKEFVGDVARFFERLSVAQVKVRAQQIRCGETLLFIGKQTAARSCSLEEMQRQGLFIREAVKGDEVGIKVPFALRPGDKVFRWIERRT